MLRLRSTTANIIALAMTMAILYALAAGPLVYMERIDRPVLSVEAFLWIYHPLNYAEAKIQPVGLTMQFYIGFWERAANRRLALLTEKPPNQKATRAKIKTSTKTTESGLGIR